MGESLVPYRTIPYRTIGILEDAHYLVYRRRLFIIVSEIGPQSSDTLLLCLCDTWQKRLLGTAAMASLIGGGAYVSTRNPGTIR